MTPKFCENCGNELKPNADYCLKCGSKINKDQPSITNNNALGVSGMKCGKCGGQNIAIQVVNESKLVTKHHGAIWWLCIGWWWIFIKWLVFTIPALIFAIFVGKRKKIKNKTKKVAVCQNCGNMWKI